MELLLLFAFLSGLVTIFAPCIWPLLPIILSATTSGGHKKPLGITLGIITSFALITLSISYIVKIIPFDPNVLRSFAVIVIGFLGLTLAIPPLSQKLEAMVSRLSGKFSTVQQAQKTGFWSGLATGLALGIVWTPCAGPILATIATLAATQAVNLNVVFVTVAYVIGVGIPLFLFATAGSVLFKKSRLLSKYTGRIQQVFGVIMILTAAAIATNYDKTLQVQLLNAFPSYSSFINQIESNPAIKQQLDTLKNKQPHSQTSSNTDDLFNTSIPAPEFIGITKWLNTDKTLTRESLKGKVVLVDFWTYTCINCIRTFPHLTSWYEKYKDQGFVIVGVHTPEFAFEKDTANVENAIKQYNIHYPVAQDNDYATWNAYSNQYWPAGYLIDAKGIIRRVHFGEGEYEQMEEAIQTLLKEAGKNVINKIDTMTDTAPRSRITPETYLGSSRMQYYHPSVRLPNGNSIFTLSDTPPQNTFSLGGEWTINDEESIAGKNAILTYTFTANNVHLVLRPGEAKQPAKVRVLLDDKLVDATNQGVDINDGIVTIDTDRLYTLIDLQGKIGTHTLKLEFLTPGIQAFAFTFG